MRPTSRAKVPVYFLCFLFSYALIITLLAPLMTKRGKAVSEEGMRKRLGYSLPGANLKHEMSPASQQQPAPRREGELLVRFRAGVSQPARDVLLATHGARRQRALRGESQVELLELAAGHEVLTTALQLRLNPEVEFAEPNFLIEKSDLTPNDPSFNQQWALSNTGQNGGQFGSDIAAPAAWQTTTGSEATVIAVIDSGVDFTHTDLTSNKWTNSQPSPSGDLNGWDYIEDNGTIQDEQGHGTAIAGIIAAQGNNGAGISGARKRDFRNALGRGGHQQFRKSADEPGVLQHHWLDHQKDRPGWPPEQCLLLGLLLRRQQLAQHLCLPDNGD